MKKKEKTNRHSVIIPTCAKVSAISIVWYDIINIKIVAWKMHKEHWTQNKRMKESMCTKPVFFCAASTTINFFSCVFLRIFGSANDTVIVILNYCMEYIELVDNRCFRFLWAACRAAWFENYVTSAGVKKCHQGNRSHRTITETKEKTERKGHRVRFHIEIDMNSCQ